MDMDNRHGVNVQELATSISSPSVAPVGIPFVIGASPVQSASAPVAAGEPILVRNWNEAVAAFGYSDDWDKYNLCEFMFSHFRLFERSPVIFCNLLDIATMSATVAAADKTITDNKIELPIEAIADENLVVKPTESGSELTVGTDYEAYFLNEVLVIEFLRDGAHFGANSANVAYKTVTPEAVNNNVVSTGMENIEKCLSTAGVVPDIICSPRYSADPTVAAIMATKCKINGIFTAKALVDLSTVGSSGAKTYQEALNLKKSSNVNDKNQIVCWPMLGNGGRKFHMSTQLAGVLATVDMSNDGIPYESPSNKPYAADSIILADGTPVLLSHPQANIVEGRGIVTALRFITGLVCWGNYTACYPENTDVKDFFIPINRMFDWVGNTVVRTHWRSLDRPMIARIIDSIIDGTNIWLNGLTGGGYLLGARVVYDEAENSLEELLQGIIRIRIFMTPPPPLKEINFLLEYDLSPFMPMAAA
jgi:hypothetical protein